MDAHPASLAPVVVAASAAPDVVRLDVLAKCRAVVRGCLLALGHDFQKAGAACLAVAGHWGAPVRRDALEQFPARQPLAVRQKVE